jgi:membrane-associated phospholipid phosphatase
VGDGLAGMVLLPYLLYYRKYRELAISTLLLAGSGLVIQLFKRYIFADYHRPSLVFSEPTLHLVEGVEMAKHFSFPSGHSCTSVVLFFILAMLIRKPTAYLPLALLAIVACISRAYLSQHFLIDTVGGGLWGLVCCTFAYKYFTRV